MEHYPTLYHEKVLGLSGGFEASNMKDLALEGFKFISRIFSHFSRLSRSFWCPDLAFIV